MLLHHLVSVDEVDASGETLEGVGGLGLLLHEAAIEVVNVHGVAVGEWQEFVDGRLFAEEGRHVQRRGRADVERRIVDVCTEGLYRSKGGHEGIALRVELVAYGIAVGVEGRLAFE